MGSTYGDLLRSINRLGTGQDYLSTLSGQLSSNVKSTKLMDYAPNEAKQLLTVSSSIAARQGYLGVINTVDTRIKIYDSSMGGIEDNIAQALSLSTSAADYNSNTNNSTAEEIKGYMSQVSYYLNQKVGDRYLFAGSRYGTAPVIADFTTLPVPPTETAPYTVNNPNLPSYDSAAGGVTTNTDATAYTQAAAVVDTTQTLTYGVSSDQQGFQQVVMGMRWAYAATQDPANYSTYMARAKDLMTNGLQAVRGYHSTLSAAQNSLNTIKARHNQEISDLQSRADSIQNIDTTEVSARITSYQSQLEASYSATAIILKTSILKYL